MNSNIIIEIILIKNIFSIKIMEFKMHKKVLINVSRQMF